MELYRKEWDLEGNIYYFLLSQEEAEKLLEQDNRIELQEGCILQIVIQRKNKRNVYSVVVPGKEY